MARRKSKRRSKKQQGQAQPSNGAVNGSNAGPARSKAPTVFVPGATPAAPATPTDPISSEWAGPDGELGEYVRQESARSLEAWAIQPNFLRGQAGQEVDIEESGYEGRQVVELLQNSADSLSTSAGARIVASLSRDFLYFSDDGTQLSEEGVKSLMHANLSPKRDTDEIGFFGQGFKSLLKVSDTIDFFSRSVSIRFDREQSRKRIEARLPDDDFDRYPAMRLADTLDPRTEAENDRELEGFMRWATNVVRVRLNGYQDAQYIYSQFESFPAELLLLVDHIGNITLSCGAEGWSQMYSVRQEGDVQLLRKDDESSPWMVFKRTVPVPTGIQEREVEIRWAVPVGVRVSEDRFWAYFPTLVHSLVAGIINARWATSSDRTNLSVNDFNGKLIEEAAVLIADNLHVLSTADDPAAHLDVLPRQPVGSDAKYANDLRSAVYGELQTRYVVPDSQGVLRRPSALYYPPAGWTGPRFRDALTQWKESKYSPSDWLHPSAMTRDRISRIGMMFPTSSGALEGADNIPASTTDRWLAALTYGTEGPNAIEASRDAIRVAALLPNEFQTPANLGRIFITRDEKWRKLDEVFLPAAGGTGKGDPAKLLHERLTADTDTLAALKTLGVVELSREEQLRLELISFLQRNPDPASADPDQCEELWRAANQLDHGDVVKLVEDQVPDYPSRIPALTESGKWQPLSAVMLPGTICTPDELPEVCVDSKFHSEDDVEILDSLGVKEAPRPYRELGIEPGYNAYRTLLVNRFRQDIGVPKARDSKMSILSTQGVGPINVIDRLPKRAQAKYFERMLAQDQLFNEWSVRHENHGVRDYDNYALWFVRKNGIVSDGEGGFVPITDARHHPAALRKLAEMETWQPIKDAFDFPEPPAIDEQPDATPEDSEPSNIGNVEPLADVWPGVRKHLSVATREVEIADCLSFLVDGREVENVFALKRGNTIYLKRRNDRDDLKEVSRELALGLKPIDITNIIRGVRKQVDQARKRVRQHTTDQGRLLEAVGEANLINGLPNNLREYNRLGRHSELRGLEAADAAIATYHSDALWNYRKDISRLDPPIQWAGGPRAVEFVTSLGFTPEWARERQTTLPAYEDVTGPFNLNELHIYQRNIVNEVRRMLKAERLSETPRRGLISLPTGAGKTRVAVQAIVEAIRDDGFAGKILWVADRRELIEQAIDSWQDVWRCIGPERRPLRVTRLYGGQDAPTQSEGAHVVVASIQTLNARLGREDPDYALLEQVNLVVIDEAHHAIAPTYIRLMDNLGFATATDLDGPVLLGLTATPYRGRNEEETNRLVSRFSRKRLDRDGFRGIVGEDTEDVIRYLQSPKMRVLAKAKHDPPIDGGKLELTDDEIKQTKDVPWLPQSAEDRLAGNYQRTERILAKCEERVSDDSPTLIFATSVDHAKTIASELCRRGIPARSVDGNTSEGTRRRIVEEYRNGKIKVLVNYGVFREGFDAPRTSIVIVARPVFAPNAYFQMIGRGLRGHEHGGNDECLIINVKDNILNFKQKLAFTELDDFWD